MKNAMFVRLLAERCVRAFVAGAAAAIAASAATTDISAGGLKALVVGAGAAGVSAVMSLISKWFGGDPDSTSFLTLDKG
jgi:malic enzyme